MSDDVPKIDLNKPWITQSTCEFCKLDIWVDTLEYALVHALPYCAEFEAMDVVSFLIENNKLKRARMEKNRDN